MYAVHHVIYHRPEQSTLFSNLDKFTQTFSSSVKSQQASDGASSGGGGGEGGGAGGGGGGDIFLQDRSMVATLVVI